eukprot:scaffold4423_cov105-Isochrysis_galbana.AAC.3
MTAASSASDAAQCRDRIGRMGACGAAFPQRVLVLLARCSGSGPLWLAVGWGLAGGPHATSKDESYLELAPKEKSELFLVLRVAARAVNEVALGLKREGWLVALILEHLSTEGVVARERWTLDVGWGRMDGGVARLGGAAAPRQLSGQRTGVDRSLRTAPVPRARRIPPSGRIAARPRPRCARRPRPYDETSPNPMPRCGGPKAPPAEAPPRSAPALRPRPPPVPAP